MASFTVIDVETANSDPGSVCAIGLVRIEDGDVADRWYTLVNPEGWFSPFNIGIHGITEDDVAGEPTFTEIYDELRDRLKRRVMVSHGAFDRAALARAATASGLPLINFDYINSQTVVRRTWPERSRRGYGLSPLAKAFGIELNHHNALSDAEAAAEIMLRAWKETKLSLADWIQYWLTGSATRSRAGKDPAVKFTGVGNPNGIFTGEVVVFTGAAGQSRDALATAARDLGMSVASSVTKNTTILVSGEQISGLVKENKSGKQRRADELISQGHDIHIMPASSFEALIEASLPRGRRT